ncbi:MAG: SUMF1/EgtB/PvdO family nonheme iron enzyme [Myxococcales bacterium]|nr:SUMF1/EgtB/PvdO family nonheme iron enzyme [Myxococcales bacterium]
MQLYDDSGERMARWRAPVRVSITTSPPARASIAEYTIGPRYVLSEARELGTTPLGPLELAPGSYLLKLESDGRAPVRYPVLVRRGESLSIELELPTAASVPEGFVYIPAGRFLVGAGVDDALRREFLHAVPLHEATTEAYLIGRDETTFADYIEFLEALSPEERARNTPKVDVSFTHRGVELTRDEDGGWTLTLIDPRGRQTARRGEKIRYPARDRNVEHDWLQMPVCGIGFEKATAYAQWLAASGKVPGARLCTGDEWERAARGADGRLFAHGDQITPADANVQDTYGSAAEVLGPDTIGLRPDAESPFGLRDATGNIIEFVVRGRGDQAVDVRGGAYPVAAFTSRISNRVEMPIGTELGSLGVRVCASYPPPG